MITRAGLIAMAAGISVTIGALQARAQEPQLLDGTEIEYSYTDGGSVVLAFYDGLLRYRWIAGPFAGAMDEDLAYKARLIGEEVYLVNWHDTDGSSFVTLVIDLGGRSLFSSALLGYSTETEFSLFDEARIERISR